MLLNQPLNQETTDKTWLTLNQLITQKLQIDVIQHVANRCFNQSDNLSMDLDVIDIKDCKNLKKVEY